MSNSNNQRNITKININNDNSIVDSIKILSEFTRKDIEKSYNLDIFKGIEAYFSNRYGWTLRKNKD
jgi:hypothetical protein